MGHLVRNSNHQLDPDQDPLKGLSMPVVDPVVTLTTKDVDLETLQPSKEFVAALALHLVRNGDSSKSGFVAIPDTRHIVGRKLNARRFQTNLMAALERAVRKLGAGKYAAEQIHDSERAQGQKQMKRPEVESSTFSGLPGDSYKFFHFDNLRHVYVSILYGPNRNITGGNPRFLDALRMAEELGFDSVHDILDRRPIPEGTDYQYSPFDQYAMLKPEFVAEAGPYVSTIYGLNPNDYPIVIFSNRLEDGILHGATQARRVSPEFAASRPLSYATLLLRPAERSRKAA